MDIQNAAELWIFEFKTSGPFGMRVEVKRKERDELEEEHKDLLDLHVPLESYAHKRACIDLIAEVDVLTDACLDGEYNAHQAAKEYPRVPLYPIRGAGWCLRWCVFFFRGSGFASGDLPPL
jgi:hypothetical protein